jgi:hypothetical protein
MSGTCCGLTLQVSQLKMAVNRAVKLFATQANQYPPCLQVCISYRPPNSLKSFKTGIFSLQVIHNVKILAGICFTEIQVFTCLKPATVLHFYETGL